MQAVPLAPVASQTLGVLLGGQSCQINLRTRTTGLFCDVYTGGVLTVGGVLCLNGILIVRDPYLGFAGDLALYDTQANTDPVYTELGAQYQLIYLTAGEVAAFQAGNAVANLAEATAGSGGFGTFVFGVSAF